VTPIRALEVITDQHRQVKHLCQWLAIAAPNDRHEGFRRLVNLLAIHETTEDLLLFPMARSTLPDGETLVDRRAAEHERLQSKMLDLEGRPPASAEFAFRLGQLRVALLDHGRREEDHLFPSLAAHLESREVEMLHTGFRVAGTVASTDLPDLASLRDADESMAPADGFVMEPFEAIAEQVREVLRSLDLT
jgi:hemerythrin superfamily protein